MKIRKLEDRRSLQKPDRSNATWKGSKLEKVSEEGSPLEKLQEQQRKLDEQREQKEQNPTGTIRRGKGRHSVKGVWNDNEQSVESNNPRWVIGLLILVPLLLLGAFAITLKLKKQPATPTVKREKVITLDKEIAALDLPPAAGDLPVTVAAAFLETSDPQERLKYVRDAERIAQLLPSFPEQARSEIPVGSRLVEDFASERVDIQRIETVFEDGNYRSLYLVRTAEGPKVDWEAYARKNNDLERWVAEANDPQVQRAEESAEVRVFLSIENYYNFRFADDQVWMSYRIYSPDLPETITAYAKRGSPTTSILDEVLGFDKKRITLQLRSRTEDARNKQYEIESVLAVGWVKSGNDFEVEGMRSRAN